MRALILCIHPLISMDWMLVGRPDGQDGKSCIFDPTVELGTCADYPYGYVLPKASLDGQSGYNPGAELSYSY